MPTEENNVEKVTTEVNSQEQKSTELNSKEGVDLSMGKVEEKPDADYAEYKAWKEQQAAAKAQEELLKPLGGVEGFNKAKEAIRNSGNVDFVNDLNSKLQSEDSSLQATGIAQMAAFMSAMSTMKPKQEEQTMSSPLPGIGQSSAPASSKSVDDTPELPEVSVTDVMSVKNIKHPRVKKAVEEMYTKFDALVEQHGTAPGSLHNLAAKAAFDTVGKLVKTSESAFGDPSIAQEALYVWGRINDQIRAKADEAGDPTYSKTLDDAQTINYQLGELERVRSNGKSSKVNYLEQMFPNKFKQQ